MPPHFGPHHRPPWWPAHEPWPPQRPPWQQGRGRFFWRIGGLLLLLFVLTVGGCTLAFWLTAVGLGWIIAPPLRPGPEFGPFSFAFWRFGGGFGIVLVILGVFLVARVFRRIAAPVGDLMEAAGRVEAGDYTARVSEHGPREMRALARAFNAMTARLQHDEAQRRTLLADVTHELRTPLTVIQGHLEGIVDGVYPADESHLAPILEETRVLSRLIDDLRTLSLAESGALQLHREPTDLGVLAGEAVAAFRAQAEAAGVELKVEVADSAPLVEVDPLRLREVLSNLISNALRYTPRGGSIRVTGEADARRATLTVRDTGAGIPPESLPHIFDRFYKSDESRGMGLGLAIARNLVMAHGGEIVAESAPGRGTLMRLTLPLTHSENPPS
jgi:signal transduction histidine kinase